MRQKLLQLLSLALLAPALAVTSVAPGTVTTVVNPNLFTKPSGDRHLHGIVRDPITGDIYVGDWSSLAVGITPFFGPYVENADSIRRIDALKEVSVTTYLVSPNAMAYNVTDRLVYVAVGSVSCGAGQPRVSGPTLDGIVAIDPATGKTRVLAGGKRGVANGAAGEAQFSGPAGIASDPGSGAFFVSESCQNRIREVDPSGDAATLAEGFNDPRGIAYCEHEHLLYVADAGNNEIRTVTLDGAVSTLAGSTQAGFADGAGSAARFDRPTGVACDNAGNVYVADSGNDAVRMIGPTGSVTTIAGGKGRGSVDGVGEAARFATPGDITYDPSERALYVVDWGSNSIRKVTLAP